jgi:protein TonB
MAGRRARSDSVRRDTGAVLGSGIARPRPRPDRRAVLGSVGFHVAIVAGLLISGMAFGQDLPQFETYRVKLYSPPPQVAGEPDPVAAVAPVVRRPEPQVVTEVPKPKPVTPPKPKPAETRTTPRETPTRSDAPRAGRNPDPSSPGGEGLNVDTEGRDFPYPEYLENIILQLNRYFRWDGNPALEGEVAFYLERDGSVGKGSLQVTQKSGDFRFDLRMMSAVEQAGRAGAFGPLPEGWISDKLWIRFRFLPPG